MNEKEIASVLSKVTLGIAGFSWSFTIAMSIGMCLSKMDVIGTIKS